MNCVGGSGVSVEIRSNKTRAPKNVDKTDFKYDIWSNQKVVSMQSTELVVYTAASSINWRIEIDVCVFLWIETSPLCEERYWPERRRSQLI